MKISIGKEEVSLEMWQLLVRNGKGVMLSLDQLPLIEALTPWPSFESHHHSKVPPT